ncbi:MAG: transposase [Rhodobacteraceae bacterium]|nr:transposase [Paracoccaceae bacterium]
MRDFSFKYRWLFGSACASRGKAVGHVSKRCNTQETNIHLADVSKAVAAGCHGVLVLDGVSYHRSKGLVVPDKLTLIHLPPYSPELNQMEQFWHFLKSNNLCNRIHATVADKQETPNEAWQHFADDRRRMKERHFRI